MKLSRSSDYVIKECIGNTSLVGKRCRLKLTAPEENVKEDKQGFMYDLEAYMLTGKQEGSTIELPPVKLGVSHKKRTCTCVAYRFPHAPGFGACKASKFEQVAPEGIKLEDLFV